MLLQGAARLRFGGIHYTTLGTMVEDARQESSGFSTMDVLDDETIRVSGFRKQATYN